MSCERGYPSPQVFFVDGAGGPERPPRPVPCWASAPPRGKSRRGPVGPCGLLLLLLLFLLVFAALGFQGYLLYKMQRQLRRMEQKSQPETESQMAEKQISLQAPQPPPPPPQDRAAAHVIGRIERGAFPKTLRWEPKVGQAFCSGGVAYGPEDGGLRLDRSGLYHVYSRVELLAHECGPASWFVHSVWVRRAGHPAALTLMEAHRALRCPRTPGQPATSESFLSSGLRLRKHDRVFVNVSRPALLSHQHYANFFGLYQI